jgi:hypothetical protein
MLERSRVIRPSFEDIYYIDQLNDELVRDPLSWQREWLRRVPRLDLAFPSVVGTPAGSGSASSGTSLSLSSGITAGELLLIFFASTLGSAASMNTPSGWTSLYHVDNSTSVNGQGFYRVADGSESSPLTISGSNIGIWAAISFRVSGHSAAQSPEAATTTGVGGPPNAPSLSPTGGAKDYLWFAVGGQATNTTLSLTAPTNYTGMVTQGASAASMRTDVAYRQLNASSENPGAFGGATTQSWIAATVAVHSGASVPLFMHHYRMMRGN